MKLENMSHEESTFEDENDEKSGNQEDQKSWLSESLTGEAKNLSLNSEVLIENTEQEVKEAGE